jgi:AraC-like DNA-binding protein
MFLTFKDRASSSPFVERVWCAHTETGGSFYSMAEGSLELVITRLPGLCRVTLRGPVTRAAPVVCPSNGQWVAIRFRTGTYFPAWPTAMLMDHSDIDFPAIGDRRFWFNGASWELPTFENAESFVHKLAREGAIARDVTVAAAIDGDRHVLSRRSVQRHFLRVTGMTQALFQQIQRARYAAKLLHAGSPILDVVHGARYFDQAHLTRSLRRLIGPTPTTILRNQVQLSFAYGAEPVPHD